MSNSIITQTMLIGEVEVPVLEYQNQRVITFAMIDKVHQRPEGTARKRFHDNREHFTEGEDYFYITDPKSLSVFRTTYPGILSDAVHNITFITELGYLLITKALTDKLAWQIQKTLIKTYFRVKEILAHPPLPYHIRRYLANQEHIPYNYFSILNEIVLRLIAPLESRNYHLPENMLPDISEGLMFNRWLRKEGIDPKTILSYIHVYEDGRRIKAKMYPIEIWPQFVKHFHEEWLPKRAHDYFQARDPLALPFLPKLLEARLTKSLTDLLKEHNAPYSARKMNKILLQMGIIEEKTRPSTGSGSTSSSSTSSPADCCSLSLSKGNPLTSSGSTSSPAGHCPSSKEGEKKFKAFTEEGRIYGKNLVTPQKPEETHPHYYVDTFEKLLIIVRNYLVQQDEMC